MHKLAGLTVTDYITAFDSWHNFINMAAFGSWNKFTDKPTFCSWHNFIDKAAFGSWNRFAETAAELAFVVSQGAMG